MLTQRTISTGPSTSTKTRAMEAGNSTSQAQLVNGWRNMASPKVGLSHRFPNLIVGLMHRLSRFEGVPYRRTYSDCERSGRPRGSHRQKVPVLGFNAEPGGHHLSNLAVQGSQAPPGSRRWKDSLFLCGPRCFGARGKGLGQREFEVSHRQCAAAPSRCFQVLFFGLISLASWLFS